MTTDYPIIPWWTSAPTDPAPIIRAVQHHHSAGVRTQFEYVGPACQPGDDGLDVPGQDRLVVNLQGNAQKLTYREAQLVAEALAAGRQIERTVAARRLKDLLDTLPKDT